MTHKSSSENCRQLVIPRYLRIEEEEVRHFPETIEGIPMAPGCHADAGHYARKRKLEYMKSCYGWYKSYRGQNVDINDTPPARTHLMHGPCRTRAQAHSKKCTLSGSEDGKTNAHSVVKAWTGKIETRTSTQKYHALKSSEGRGQGRIGLLTATDG